MSVCACPLGAVHQGCEHHQEIAQRFLENLNTTTPQLGHVTRSYSRGGYVHQADPPLIVQHYAEERP